MDLETTREIDRLEEALYRFQPSRQWQIKTVTFPSTIGQDLDIAHALTPSNPERVSFQVLQANGPVLVYKDLSAIRTAWSAGLLRLRCTSPSAQVVLLFTAEGDDDTRTDPIGSVSVFGFNGVQIGTENSVLGPNISLRNTNSMWSIYALNNNTLAVRDESEAGNTSTLNIIKTAVGPPTEYDIRPANSAISIRVGTNTSGQRMAEVNSTTINGLTITAATSFVATGLVQLKSRLAPAQITSNQNDYAISTACRVFISSDAARDITGIAAGVDGQVLKITNFGGFTITLKNNSGSSAVGNRIVANADIPITSNSTVVLTYDTGSGFWWVDGI